MELLLLLALKCSDVWCEGPYHYDFVLETKTKVTVLSSKGTMAVCPKLEPGFSKCMNEFDDKNRGIYE